MIAAYGEQPRVAIIAAAILIVVLLLSVRGLARFYTDFLWFDSVGYRNVWLRNWGLSILLGAIGIGVSFLILWVNLRLVDRLTPRFAPFDLTEEEELVERFRAALERQGLLSAV